MTERVKKNKQKIIKKTLRKGHFKRNIEKESNKFASKIFTYDLPSRKTIEASHCSLAFLIVLGFASIVVLILDVWLFALPVLSTSNFRSTMCRVQGYEFKGFQDCKCGGLTNASPYCTSKFPCVHITVDYNIHTKTASNSTQTSIVYQDEAVLQAETFNCSFATCNEVRKMNTIELESFKSEYGNPGAIYKCMYNRDNTKEVIITRRYGMIVLILSLGLPILILLVSVFLFFIVCKTTVHTQVKQLRIKSTRAYIKSGVKLPDGTRTTAAMTSQLQLPGGAQIQHHEDETERQVNPEPPKEKKKILLGRKKKSQDDVTSTHSL